MNRRSFFTSLAAIAATATLDPERLLWRPGAKLISIPKPPRVLLSFGDAFTIAGVYAKNPVTGEIAILTDDIAGERYRFLQRFYATAEITDHDGDGEWKRKSVPAIYCDVPWRDLEPVGRGSRFVVEPIHRTAGV